MADRDVDIDVNLRDKTERGAREVRERLRKLRDDADKESDKLGDGIGKGFTQIISSISPKLGAQLAKGIGSAGELGGPLMVAGIAAATPMLAATVSAAVIGGAGVGGVIGGVLLASRDARVQSAGKDLGSRLLEDLQDRSSVFVQPILDGITTVEASYDRMGDRIDSIFGNASKFVAPLTTGATRGVEGILRGVDALVAEGKPVIDELATGFDDLGNDVGTMFEQISGGSDGAARAVQELFFTVEGLVQVLGPTVEGLTKVYGLLSKIGLTGNLFSNLNALLGQHSDAAARAGDQEQILAQGFQAVTEDTYDYAAGLQQAEQAVRGVHDANRSLYASNTEVAAALDNATKQLKENGRTLSLHSEKGRENRQVLSDLAQKLTANYEAALKVNGVGPKTDAVAEKNRAAFIRLATQMGLSAGKARALADQLLGIPASRTTRIEADTAAATARVKEVRRQMDQLRNKKISVDVIVNSSRLNKVQNQLERFGHGAFSGAGGGRFAAVGGGGSARTGGPAEVTVAQTLNVSLDGAPFYAYTARTVDAGQRRADWRNAHRRR